MRHGMPRGVTRGVYMRTLRLARAARSLYGDRLRARNLLRGALPVDSVVRRRPIE